jgi:hypothetical protein
MQPRRGEVSANELSRLGVLDVWHVSAHDELSQVVDGLFERGDAVLDLDGTLECFNTMIEVAVDAMLFNGSLIPSLVGSSSGIGVWLLHGHSQGLHGMLLVSVSKRLLSLRMLHLGVVDVNGCIGHDICRSRRHGRHGRVVRSRFRRQSGCSNFGSKCLCKVANVLTSHESIWPVLAHELQRL